MYYECLKEKGESEWESYIDVMNSPSLPCDWQGDEVKALCDPHLIEEINGYRNDVTFEW